jgi:hypothetical protein
MFRAELLNYSLANGICGTRHICDVVFFEVNYFNLVFINSQGPHQDHYLSHNSHIWGSESSSSAPSRHIHLCHQTFVLRHSVLAALVLHIVSIYILEFNAYHGALHICSAFRSRGIRPGCKRACRGTRQERGAAACIQICRDPCTCSLLEPRGQQGRRWRDQQQRSQG